ncbi:hypothetical protein [Paraburkholderia phenoliruptrix]|uniref:hypothetical protein n=1 Tax=Paraburkholderia phenoliruptrix TaxID=252970 RepID=UPI0009DA2D7B|nr:hypothetical protein [Paraburkholderia phenoliruptrix]WMY12855.1 hypothetical protein P3F88_20710 [Paraburkholderia phenoliruptrix]
MNFFAYTEGSGRGAPLVSPSILMVGTETRVRIKSAAGIWLMSAAPPGVTSCIAATTRYIAIQNACEGNRAASQLFFVAAGERTSFAIHASTGTRTTNFVSFSSPVFQAPSRTFLMMNPPAHTSLRSLFMKAGARLPTPELEAA